MKKYLLFLIIFISAITQIKATDWFPIGAKWTWGEREECCGPPPIPDNPFYWNVEKDTTIQGRYCKIINTSYNSRIIFTEDNNIIKRFIDNRFLPTYDFNKQAGDTALLVTDTGYYSCDSIFFVIDSVKPLPKIII